MLWSFHGFLEPGWDPETVGFGYHRVGGGEQVMNSSYLHSLYFLCKDQNIKNPGFQADPALEGKTNTSDIYPVVATSGITKGGPVARGISMVVMRGARHTGQRPISGLPSRTQ